jgi:hypothetical protein
MGSYKDYLEQGLDLCPKLYAQNSDNQAPSPRSQRAARSKPHSDADEDASFAHFERPENANCARPERSGRTRKDTHSSHHKPLDAPCQYTHFPRYLPSSPNVSTSSSSSSNPLNPAPRPHSLLPDFQISHPTNRSSPPRSPPPPQAHPLWTKLLCCDDSPPASLLSPRTPPPHPFFPRLRRLHRPSTAQVPDTLRAAPQGPKEAARERTLSSASPGPNPEQQIDGLHEEQRPRLEITGRRQSSPFPPSQHEATLRTPNLSWYGKDPFLRRSRRESDEGKSWWGE